ncbi:MAG: tryptophan synthase subunit alpha [bacterium]
MKIEDKFTELQQRGEAALIAYYTFGFPSVAESLKNISLLAKNGADMIEIGIPFSDPLADGPVIQKASYIALQNKVNLPLVFDSLSQLKCNIPLIIMSCINPILRYGLKKTLEQSKRAKVSGFIIQDLPVDEATEYINVANSNKIDTIFLLTPSSTEERIKMGLQYSKGFIYCVSVTGTTGMRNKINNSTIGFIQKVSKLTSMPVAVGFGVSTQEQVRELKKYANGIIIGSRLIMAVMDGENLSYLIRELKQGTL